VRNFARPRDSCVCWEIDLGRILNRYNVDVEDFTTLKAGDDAASAKFVSVQDILDGKVPLAFDHVEGVRKLVEWNEKHKSRKRKSSAL